MRTPPTQPPPRAAPEWPVEQPPTQWPSAEYASAQGPQPRAQQPPMWQPPARAADPAPPTQPIPRIPAAPRNEAPEPAPPTQPIPRVPAAPPAPAPPADETLADRLGDDASWRNTLSDGLTIVQRNLLKMKHNPGQIVATFAFPLVSVVLFGYVFGSAIPVGDGGNYREFLMPGLFVMGSFFAMMSSLGVIAKDNGLGVMDRFRSMPMARSAVPFGQTGSDLILGILSMLVMAGVGLLFGWRAHNGIGPTVGAFAMLALLQYAVSWVGAYLGARVKDEETAGKIAPLMMPITMISNVFVPTDGMPAALRIFADWNPISAAVAACRDLFGNPGIPTGSEPAWPLANPVLATVGWSVLLLLIFVPLSIRRFRSAGL